MFGADEMKSRYFKDNELSCSCCGELVINDNLVAMLDVARFESDIPYIITSGYRCEEYNKKIGGSPTSSHTNGTAVDIATSNSTQRSRVLQGLIKAGFTRLGIAKSFIHVDIDVTKVSNVSWLYD